MLQIPDALQFRQLLEAQLARTAGQTGPHLRGLTNTERDDVLAAALLAAWERRDEFDPVTDSFAHWFANHVRSARRDFLRGKRKHVELPPDLVATDDVAASVEAEDTVAALSRTDLERAAVEELLAGYSVRETAARTRVPRRRVRSLANALKAIKPEPRRFTTGSRTPARRSSDDMEGSGWSEEPRPHPGKPCPPCWKCLWYQGWLPKSESSTDEKFVCEEVRAAALHVNERKVEIAREVRAGDVQWG